MVKMTMQYAIEWYLRLLLYLLHHVNLQVPAAVHLIDIAGDDLSNVQVGVVGDVQLGPAAL